MSNAKGLAPLGGRYRRSQTPWPAILLASIAVVCMIATAIVVVISNHKPVASWAISPAVLIAFFSSIWNGSVTLLLTMSIAVIWWRAASHGSSLESLHCIWNKGLGLKYLSALRSNTSACQAVLLSWLVIVAEIAHNPLLQRSTSTIVHQLTSSDDMVLGVAERIPDGWIGTVVDAAVGSIVTYPNSTTTIRDWWLNATIPNPGPDCDGSCQGRVRGSGIDYGCSSTSSTLNLTSKDNSQLFIFGINTMMTSDSTGAPILSLSTLYSSSVDENCMAVLTSWNCNIQAATVEYPFLVQNSTITLDSENLYPPVVVEPYVSDGDRQTAKEGQGAGPLLGLHDFITSTLATNVSLIVHEDFSAHNGELISDIFYQFNTSAYNPAVIGRCRLEWVDPTQYVLTAMQDYLFRSSITVHTEEDSQHRPVQRTSQVLIFQSNFRFLIAALALMTFAVLCVLAPFWNWWELGRHVTLSPVELANAFGALSLHCSNDVRMVDDILKVAGKTTVKYDGMRFSNESITLQMRPSGMMGSIQNSGYKGLPD